MLRRSQISVFFVVGVVLIVVVLFATSFNEEEHEKEISPSSVIDLSPEAELQSFVESCLQQIGEQAIYDVMLQGGYHDVPFDSVSIFSIRVPIYWDGIIHMPSQSDIALELSKYVQQQLNTCLDDFSALTEKGYSVVSTAEAFGFNSVDAKNEVEAIIREGNVLYIITAPLEIQTKDSRFLIDQFSTSVNIDITRLHDSVSQIVATQLELGDLLPTGLLSELAHEKGFTFEVIYTDDTTVVIAFIQEVPNKDDLVYAFAHTYDWDTPEDASTFDGGIQ